VAVAALTGCTSSPAVPVAVPDGRGAGCERLHHALPDSLDAGDRRDTEPVSARTAAWGSPPVVLRCGVPRPDGLAADSELIEVNGVSWYLAEPTPPYVFTVVDRDTFVQVRVPRSVPRDQATAPLVDLAGAVQETLRQR
jgi:hypothetical protein